MNKKFVYQVGNNKKVIVFYFTKNVFSCTIFINIFKIYHYFIRAWMKHVGIFS
jgi:hypothetical protein